MTLDRDLTGDGISKRKKSLIEMYAKVQQAPHAKSAFWISACKFYRYEETLDLKDLEEAKAMFWFGIDRTVSAFGLTGGLYNYHTYQHLYDEEMLDAFRRQYINTDLYDKERYTANHLLMSVTTRYLAEELFPGEIECVIFEEDPTCRTTLLRLLEDYVHNGEPEWNSGSYLAVHYACLRLLAQYAEDKSIRKRSELVAEWLLNKAAVTWMDGHIALSNERAYKPFRAQNEANGGTMLLYIYFGGVTPMDHEGWFNVHALISDYMPPRIMMDIVESKRQESYSHKEMHYFHLKDRIHFYDANLTGEGRTDVSNYVCLYSHMNPTFGMYSCTEWVEPSHEYVEFMDRFYIQMHRWGLCFTGKEGPSVFYMENPSGVKTKEVGASAWERVFQHKNTLIGIYSIPQDRTDRYLQCFLPMDKRSHNDQRLEAHLKEHHNYIIGHIPTNYVSCINCSEHGRIYLDYGDFMLAVCLTGAFEWDGTEPEFRRVTENLGFVIETSMRYDTIEAFKEAVGRQFDKLIFDEEHMLLTYESLDGPIIRTSFFDDGRRLDHIDGRRIDYSQHKLIDNPWMTQDFHGDVLTICHKDQVLIYDFGKWEKRFDNGQQT